MAVLKNEKVSYETLVRNSENIPYEFPLTSNLVQTIATTDQLKAEVAENATNTRPILHSACLELIEDFLRYKRKHGSPQEKNLYAKMTTEAFVDRLLKNRPLCFYNFDDQYLLRDGKTRLSGGTETIGTPTEKPPLILRDYLSYPEIEISALLGVSSPTHFINDVDRNNMGVPSKTDNFERRGVFVGQVGARFEKPGVMEYKHLVITPAQNTEKNGYGQTAKPENPKTQELEHFAKFYGQQTSTKKLLGKTTTAFRFPSYKEATADKTGKYLRLNDGNYLNIAAYKQRLRMVIEPFLLDANERGREAGKKAVVRPVGLGLGVWALGNAKLEQTQLMLEVYADLLAEQKFDWIADIDFIYINNTGFGKIQFQQVGSESIGNFKNDKNNITIHFSKNNPATKIPDDKILVAQYAWDGGSRCGNEYWLKLLAASGDPAAVSGSCLGQIQNPDINPNVSGANLYVCDLNIGVQRYNKAGVTETTETRMTAPAVEPIQEVITRPITPPPSSPSTRSTTSQATSSQSTEQDTTESWAKKVRADLDYREIRYAEAKNNNDRNTICLLAILLLEKKMPRSHETIKEIRNELGKWETRKANATAGKEPPIPTFQKSIGARLELATRLSELLPGSKTDRNEIAKMQQGKTADLSHFPLVVLTEDGLSIRFFDEQFGERLYEALQKGGFQSLAYNKDNFTNKITTYHGKLTIEDHQEIRRLVLDTCHFNERDLKNLYDFARIKNLYPEETIDKGPQPR